jgi:hypothetical protein
VEDWQDNGRVLLGELASTQEIVSAENPLVGTDDSSRAGDSRAKEAWIEQATQLLDNLHTRASGLENDRRLADYSIQQEAQRDEAIARRDIAQLQLKLWRRVANTPALLLGCLQDFIAELRQ